jgi:hypothetical protein
MIGLGTGKRTRARFVRAAAKVPGHALREVSADAEDPRSHS